MLVRFKDGVLMQSNILPLISIASLLAYVPILCYLDWKHRDIGTHNLWLPLLAVNIPILAACYWLGTYPIEMLLITALMAVAWLLLLHKRGADAVWIACITMFVVVSPISGYLFALPFLMYLIGYTAVTFWAIYLDNRLHRGIRSFSTENGIPFLIPISCAFITALVMG